MDIQEIITYVVVGLAIAFTIKTFIRQFTSDESSCPKCSQCGTERSTQQTTQLIEIDKSK